MSAPRRIPALLGLALLTVLATTSCQGRLFGQSPTPSAPAQAASPTPGIQATPYPGKPTPAQPLPTPYLTACSATSLQVTVLPAAQYDNPSALAPTGYADETIELVNNTVNGCYLNSPSLMALASSSATQSAVDIPSALSGSSQQVAPDTMVMVTVGTPLTCASPTTTQVMSSLTVTFPATGSMDVRGLNLSTQCAAPVLLVFQDTYLSPSPTPAQ